MTPQLLFGVKDLYGILSLFLELGIVTPNNINSFLKTVGGCIMSQGSSILDALRSSTSFNGNGNGNGNKPQSEFWLNIGYEVDGHFVSLPKGGVPIDNMEADKVSNPDSEYGQLLLAQNYLLKQLQELAKELMPGEAKTIPALTVQLRRKKASVEIPAEANSSKFIKNIL